MATELAIVSIVVIGLALLWIVGERIRQDFIRRRFLRERGMTFDELESQSEGSGTLLLDYVYGRSLGLPTPTIWWTPHSPGQPYPCDVVIDKSKFVDAPAESRDISFLRQRFGKIRILESTSL